MNGLDRLKLMIALVAALGITGSARASDIWPAELEMARVARHSAPAALDQSLFAQWQVLWSPALEQPVLGMGRPVDVSTTAPGDLIALVASATGAEGEFRFDQQFTRRGRTRLHYREYHGNLPVLAGRAEVVLNERQQIMRWSLRPHGHWPVLDSHLLDMASAAASLAATQPGPEWQPDVAASFAAWYPDHERHALRPVYWLRIAGNRPHECWEGVVDAMSGAVLLDWPGIRTDVVSGTVQGEYWQPYIHSDVQIGPHAFQSMTMDGEADTTDATGEFAHDVGASTVLMTALRGPYVEVHDDEQPTRELTRTENQPYAPIQWTWTRAEATEAELNLFHHVMFIHEWMRALDPPYNALDYPMPAIANYGDGFDNAFWNGQGIFFGDGLQYSNFAMFSDVIYHEYTHGVTDGIYPPGTLPYRGQSGALNEAWSDYVGCTINGDQWMGEYIQGGNFNSWFRNLVNDLVFPEDWYGEVHFDSQFISAPLWTVRQQLGAEIADDLAHYARYALAETFLDYLVAVFEEDDDDGDLSNGTPHDDVLYAAFGEHGVGPGDEPEFALRDLTYYADGTGGSIGDGDRFVEPGETVELTFVLANEAILYPPPATDIHVTVHTTSTHMTVQNGVQELDQLGAGQSHAMAPIQFVVDAAAPEHWAVVHIDVTANGGEATFADSFEFSVGTPHVLIVEDDPSTEVERYVQRQLRASDRIYDRVELGTGQNLPAGRLLYPGLLVWMSGNAEGSVITPADQALIEQYIAQGNRVLLTGQDLVDDLAGTPFAQDVLGVEIATDSLRNFAVTTTGTPFEPDEWFLLTGSRGAGNQQSVSAFTPLGTSRAVAYYGTGDSGPIAAVEFAAGRGLLLGFGVEAISGMAPSSTDLAGFFERITTWAQDVMPVDEPGLPEAVLPQQFAMGAAYPNPFNSSTTLTYTIPTGQSGELWIFDVLGRVVESRILQSGAGKVSWSPQVSSGVYFAQLRWEQGRTQPLKLLLVR